MNWYDEMPNIPAKIQRALSLVNKYKDEIGERQLLIDALEDQMTDLINSICPIVSEKMMSAAFYQQHKEKKADRPMYEAVKDILIENFFEKCARQCVKLKQITHGGYDGYYYSFEFMVYSYYLSLRIPSNGNITKKNLGNCSYGQYALYHDDNGILKCLKKSYDVKEIADAVDKFLDVEEEDDDD